MKKLDKYIIEFVMFLFFISIIIILVGTIYNNGKRDNEIKTVYITSDNKPITAEPSTITQRVCYGGVVYYSNYDGIPVAVVYDKDGKVVLCYKK